MADGQMIENPEFTLEDWQYEVANGDTRKGYETWLRGKMGEDEIGGNMKAVIAPTEVWDTVMETLRIDAQSHAFDADLRKEISVALDGMQFLEEVKGKEDFRLEDWRYHDGDDTVEPHGIDVSALFSVHRYDFDFGDGRMIWIEQEGGVIFVHCYDAAHDDPVNVRIGQTVTTVDTEQENGLMMMPSR